MDESGSLVRGTPVPTGLLPARCANAQDQIGQKELVGSVERGLASLHERAQPRRSEAATGNGALQRMGDILCLRNLAMTENGWQEEEAKSLAPPLESLVADGHEAAGRLDRDRGLTGARA